MNNLCPDCRDEPPTCPTCGDTFDQRRGLKIHHTKAHGNPLPGHSAFCENCNPAPPEDELKRLYYQEGLSQTAIADRFGVGQVHISQLMRAYEIAPGKRVDLAADARRVNRATYRTDLCGYEVWKVREGDEMRTLGVHRLAAVAWFGFDAVAGCDVHHVNEIPWDNREENFRVLSPEAHRSVHANSRERDGGGRFA